MLTQTFRIALIISLGVHIFWMSVIGLVTPEDGGRNRPYTRVDFLGPILRKSAFDIMIDGVYQRRDPMFSDELEAVESRYLDINIERGEGINITAGPMASDKLIDESIIAFLKESKTVPDIILNNGIDSFTAGDWLLGGNKKHSDRSVIYRPEVPDIDITEYHPGKSDFIIKARVLVDKDGAVKKVEPLNTTGFPELDIIAFKYLKGWIFEPGTAKSLYDEWVNVKFVLNAGDR